MFVPQLLWLARCIRQHAEMVKESLRCSYALRATTPCAGKAAVREKACGPPRYGSTAGGHRQKSIALILPARGQFRFGGCRFRGEAMRKKRNERRPEGLRRGRPGSRPYGRACQRRPGALEQYGCANARRTRHQLTVAIAWRVRA